MNKHKATSYRITHDEYEGVERLISTLGLRSVSVLMALLGANDKLVSQALKPIADQYLINVSEARRQSSSLKQAKKEIAGSIAEISDPEQLACIQLAISTQIRQFANRGA